MGEGWLRGCCCCAGDAPWAKGVEAAYAAFALLDADDGFAGWDGVGVAIARNVNVDVVMARGAVANAVAFGCAQSTCLLCRGKLEQYRAKESVLEARSTAATDTDNLYLSSINFVGPYFAPKQGKAVCRVKNSKAQKCACKLPANGM